MITRRRGRGVPARALNPVLRALVGRLGVPLPDIVMLRVHDRRTGHLQTVPLAVARVGRARYLVAVRGRTGWSSNLEAAGWGELLRGSRVERVTATPVAGAERERALAAYLRRHGWANRRLLGLPRRASAQQIAAAAEARPAFRLEQHPPLPH